MKNPVKKQINLMQLAIKQLNEQYHHANNNAIDFKKRRDELIDNLYFILENPLTYWANNIRGYRIASFIPSYRTKKDAVLSAMRAAKRAGFDVDSSPMVFWYDKIRKPERPRF